MTFDKLNMAGEHEEMRWRNQEKIEVQYLKAMACDSQQPVVFVLHLDAPQAPELLGLGDRGRIADHVQEAERRGVDPIIVGSMKMENAVVMLGGYWPEVADALGSLEGGSMGGMFPLVCINQLGASVAFLSIPRSTPG
jgi:hypothetical protein